MLRHREERRAITPSIAVAVSPSIDRLLRIARRVFWECVVDVQCIAAGLSPCGWHRIC